MTPHPKGLLRSIIWIISKWPCQTSIKLSLNLRPPPTPSSPGKRSGADASLYTGDAQPCGNLS